MQAIDILVILALVAVVVILGLGFYSLQRGGEFGLKWSNRLMRYRIMAQVVAFGLVLIDVAVKTKH
jgi:hypothetical protein